MKVLFLTDRIKIHIVLAGLRSFTELSTSWTEWDLISRQRQKLNHYHVVGILLDMDNKSAPKLKHKQHLLPWFC